MQHIHRLFTADDFVWALGSACALSRIPFDANLVLNQYPAPHNESSLITAARALGFRISATSVTPAKLAKLSLPCLIVLKPAESVPTQRLAILTQCDGTIEPAA